MDMRLDMSLSDVPIVKDNSMRDFHLSLPLPSLPLPSLPLPSTPALEMPKRSATKRRIFGITKGHSDVMLKRNLFDAESSHLNDKRSSIPKINQNFQPNDEPMNVSDFENSLGFSPVKNKDRLYDNRSIPEFKLIDSFSLFNDKPFDSKSFNVSDESKKAREFDNALRQCNGNSLMHFSPNSHTLKLSDENFKSFSKCSDLDLKDYITIENASVLSKSGPNESSIGAYFAKNSEPLTDVASLGFSSSPDFRRPSTFGHRKTYEKPIKPEKTNGKSPMDVSFVSVLHDISASDHTIDVYKKIMNKKSSSIMEKSRRDSLMDTSFGFRPSGNSSEIFSKGVNRNEKNAQKCETSGIGTLTARDSKLSKNSRTFSVLSGQTIDLKDVLIIEPNDLQLTIGCYAPFKLNYLRVKNRLSSPFKLSIKLSANSEALNSIYVKIPSEYIIIPPFFDGILSENIVITPINCGIFDVAFEIYPIIDNCNLPINPIIIRCFIKSEKIIFQLKMPLHSNSINIRYNLFYNNAVTKYIEFIIGNYYYSNDIPLKFSLEGSRSIYFDTMYSPPDSVINFFRCPDSKTLHLTTKTQYTIKIPLKINFMEEAVSSSTLTASIDSNAHSHSLGIYHIITKFWRTNEITNNCLQCDTSSLSLENGQWKEINFRNKSNDKAIEVSLECAYIKSGSTKRFPKRMCVLQFSEIRFIVPPLEKHIIGVCGTETRNTSKDKNYVIIAKYSGGNGKIWTVTIPFSILL